ncbi:deazaflavin-dependent oxidoreductase, nitroreductase family [Streptomyces sp. yr375]|uniref:nitroreductase/quinone reductase family protein n=1 Tax=Streptomyces sp. yr375 TaxID=1761906 RepID=UPI0008B6ED02|nr:nitroreductase/quinone reductase family protein [Streptomyces sp. yr375]SEQ08003.1 deazaflavin-dependent oxidoreductase, nitroreductase family [Streptomyces sp. yr375]
MTARRSLSPRHRARNHVVILLHRLGLPFGPMHLLTVPGRTSGLPRTTPVAPVVVDGTRYLLQAYPGSDWVKNARAAGHGVLTRGRRAQRVELVELPEAERGRVLREFPVQNPRGAGAFVRNGLVASGSPADFEAAAARCPVFRVVPRPS